MDYSSMDGAAVNTDVVVNVGEESADFGGQSEISAALETNDKQPIIQSQTANTSAELEADSVTVDLSPKPLVSGVRTASTLRQESTGTVNGEVMVSGVVTSQQAAVKRRPNSKQDSTAASSQATNLKDFECPSGDRYTQHDSMLENIKTSIRRVIDHIAFRALTIILIIIDLCIVLVAVIKSETAADPADKDLIEELRQLDYVALVFSCYFVVEVGLRIFSQGPKLFFRQVLEVIDFFVILVTFIVVVVDLSVDAANNTTDFLKVLQALRLVRTIRFGMLLRVIITQRQQIIRSSRLLVSENKRRFQKDGFDLDLCYITDRMIAMSFPSQGIMSLYRNPIEEVSRFFNHKYPGKYRIYNCCSERGYDEVKYFNDSVYRVRIDDHNVPTLQQMLDFVKDVEQWMNADRSNIIAIHCKGGKGRTGTMICIWLLHSGIFTKADDALEYFGSRRTDLSVGSAFQGVQTPSQSRYVNYYEKMLTEHGGSMPNSRLIKITKMSVTGLRGIGMGDGSDLILQIILGGDLIYEARFGIGTNCETVFERESATITASLINSPNVSGDVKVRFDATSKIPRDYDNCPWFFWFNTSFLGNQELVLTRGELDNPHQPRAWKTYKENFKVTMQFEDCVSM